MGFVMWTLSLGRSRNPPMHFLRYRLAPKKKDLKGGKPHTAKCLVFAKECATTSQFYVPNGPYRPVKKPHMCSFLPPPASFTGVVSNAMLCY